MRISRLDRSSVDEKTAEVFDYYQKIRGDVPDMFRIMAHRREIMRSMVAHFRAVMETGLFRKSSKSWQLSEPRRSTAANTDWPLTPSWRDG